MTGQTAASIAADVEQLPRPWLGPRTVGALLVVVGVVVLSVALFALISGRPN